MDRWRTLKDRASSPGHYTEKEAKEAIELAREVLEYCERKSLED